ncbi:MAG: septum formation protein Maf [Opitutae bacterium]|nr:septum formation protein Maf [Opitutae bacterium]
MQRRTGKANTNEKSFLILASGSPRRRDLLYQMGVSFEVHCSGADEITSHVEGPLAMVKENAKIKCLEVSKKFPDRFILGADTTVSLKNQIFGKPSDLEEAREMLFGLSGKTHDVSTGVCLSHQRLGYIETKVETSSVKFKEISGSTIDLYFEEIDPLDKAGAYAMQTRPDLIIEKYSGSRTNIIGLPVRLLEGWFSELRTLFPTQFLFTDR